MVAKVIGVDFGSSGIKLAEVVRAKGVFTVRKQAFLPLPRGFILDGGVQKDKVGETATMLKEFVAAEKFSTKFAVAGLNATSGVFASRAVTGWHNPKDFREAIKFDIATNKALLPGAPDEVTVDAAVFRDFVDDQEERKLDLLLVGVADGFRDLQLEVIKKAGLSIVGAEVNALASLHAVQYQQRPPGTLDMLVDIGQDVLSVLIHDSGRPMALTLSEGFAGQAVSEMISHAIVDDDMARIDREKVDSPTDPRIISAIDEYCYKVASAIESAASNYLAEHGQANQAIAQITLVGAGAILYKFRSKLEASFGIPAVIARFDPAIEGEPQRWHEGDVVRADYVAAVGLAMGKVV